MARYYQSSNKMPLPGVLLTLLGGVLTAVVLATAYVYLTWYIPFIYFNFCFTVILGGVVGRVGYRLARWGHLRSPGGATALVLLAALAAVYVQWAVYLTLIINQADYTTNTHFDAAIFTGLLLSPARMWQVMHLVSADGFWAVLGIRPSGTFLWLIWVVEALIIVVVALPNGRDTIGQPYSETARRWAEEQALPQLLEPQPNLGAARAALEGSQFGAALHPTTADDATPGEFWQLRLHRVPQDPNCHYLSLDKLTRKLDKQGKLQLESDVLVQHLAVTPAEYEALLIRFGVTATPAAAVAQP